MGNEAKRRIVSALLGLGANPRPIGCLKVRGAEGVCRIRVGGYRVAYMVDDSARLVRVIHIGLRDHFYD